MRLVSLVPSLTEALVLLGLGDSVVGVTDYCRHPEAVVARATKVGGTKDPDLGAVRALRPDLVLANTDEQRAETLAALEREPYDTLVTETDSLAEVAETWTQLGDATGREETARAERDRLERAIRAAREHSQGEPRLSTLVPVWKDPWMAAGGGTYLGDLLAHCGFDNVLGAAPEKWVRFEPTLDPGAAAAKAAKTGRRSGETVYPLSSAPQTVLLPTEPYRFEEKHREDFAGLGIGEDRVHVVDGELLTWWLSRSVEALAVFTGLHDGLVAAGLAEATPRT